MIELNDLYDYGLKIYQNTDYFKFSIDSILLGEFIKIKARDKILDMCTGNAPIPLILVTRNPKIEVDAVEIQKEVYNLAKKSVEINKLEDTIHLYNEDIRLFNREKKYDTVLANPPYFKITETSQKNENRIKMTARHEISLSLEDVIKTARNMLKENGTLYIVHRVDRFLDAIRILEKEKFGIRKTVFVYTKSNGPAEFFLLEASKYKKTDMKVESLYIKNLTTYKDIFKER